MSSPKGRPTPKQSKAKGQRDTAGKIADRQRQQVHDALLADAHAQGMKVLAEGVPAEEIVHTLYPQVVTAERFAVSA